LFRRHVGPHHFPFGPRGSMVSGRQWKVIGADIGSIFPDSLFFRTKNPVSDPWNSKFELPPHTARFASILRFIARRHAPSAVDASRIRQSAGSGGVSDHSTQAHSACADAARAKNQTNVTRAVRSKRRGGI